MTKKEHNYPVGNFGITGSDEPVPEVTPNELETLPVRWISLHNECRCRDGRKRKAKQQPLPGFTTTERVEKDTSPLVVYNPKGG